ncbi:MAG: response regulator transcription factor [Peptococcaceae bacterium]|jgi:DNA-binding NarL/FixJ family response regulator|nr:response regulator transcription factor [Peptococcaceae bacterium]MDH7525519.1 response regulator transcription factor [Peptococcaceae bacterium]
MVRVLIADDHALLAESLQFILQQDDDIDVVGIAANGREAVQMCERLAPQVVLMDIKMLECDGLQAVELIKQSWPQTRITMLTTFEDKDNILAALMKGADGYLLKDVRPQELVLAIKCIDSGFCVLNGSVKDVLREELNNLTIRSGNPVFGRLKSEDIRIIELIGDGKNNKEIAEIMNYSEGTIKNRISRILEIIGAKDRTQIVLFALKNGLL